MVLQLKRNYPPVGIYVAQLHLAKLHGSKNVGTTETLPNSSSMAAQLVKLTMTGNFQIIESYLKTLTLFYKGSGVNTWEGHFVPAL